MSKRPTRTLLGMITDRAFKTFPMDLLAGPGGDPFQLPHQDFTSNFRLWEDHWFKVADGIVRDFRAEGLLETVKACEDIIQWQREHVTYSRKQEEKPVTSANLPKIGREWNPDLDWGLE